MNYKERCENPICKKCRRHVSLTSVAYPEWECDCERAHKTEHKTTDKRVDIDFDNIVDLLFPSDKPKARTIGLLVEMLSSKAEYMRNNKFLSYEDEKRWMSNYLKEHWYDNDR